MDSRQLSYFRSVVDHRSFTHAAAALDMTQPSLSLSIRKLEKELDVQLLTRGRAGVSTTEAGDYLYTIAIKMETLMTEADQRIREIVGGLAGSISINAAPEFNWAFMPEILSRMFEVAPDVKLFLEDPEPIITLERVLDGSIDLGLMPSIDPRAFAQQHQDQLVVHVVAEFPMLLAVPERLKDLPDEVALADITHETWILPQHHDEFPGLPDLLRTAWFQNPESKPAHIQEVSTLQTAMPLVAGGIGAALLPDSAQRHAGDHVFFKKIKGDFPSMQPILIYRKDKDLSPAANQLVDIILEVGAEGKYH